MNLGEFHAKVSNAIRRGTSLDAAIPFWVADAARLMEQNYTYSWMRKKTNVVFQPQVEQLKWQLDPLVKSIRQVRLVTDKQDGYEWYGDPLRGVEEDEVTGVTWGMPAAFWMEGLDFLCLDANPQQLIEFRVLWNQFTDWPVNDLAQPTLLLRGQSALFFQTLILFANQQRDARMAETYAGLLQGALEVLNKSEESLKLDHQNDLQMGYVANR